MERNIAIGILAHVDAGKTTLTESMLLKSGAIRKAGRVDHRDSFLDTDIQERARGITIYDKNAVFEWNNMRFTVIDTPGHTDFAGETERALGVLDAAILVISAPSGVQSHTETLWRLCEIYNVPVFIFVNKTDLPCPSKSELITQLKTKLCSACAEADCEEFYELAAESDEEALEKYLDDGIVAGETVKSAVAGRKLFPCVFGSALRHEGTESLLNAIASYAESRTGDGLFSAKVYKISHDPKGERLAFLKILSGELKVRTPIRNVRLEDGEEKVSSIRIYSGEKYKTEQTARAGDICAVTGLKSVIAGDVLGEAASVIKPVLEPVFTYSVILPEGTDQSNALKCFGILEEEDPLLKVDWNERYAEIRIQVMGDVALEILRETLKNRFSLNVAFGTGSILYKETIAEPVNGAAHYEPLRHYAEVHLRLEPAPRGSGISIRSELSVDELALNWQRLIFTHIGEKQHAGALTGSPLTDVVFTLTAGRAHLKHTEGGDFRQATYRAIRQALMKAKNVLLEPWYEINLKLPQDCAGRAINDISRMGGKVLSHEVVKDSAMIRAKAPVRLSADYRREVVSYTKGRGTVSFTLSGYEECADADKIVAQIGYDPERDTENPADSVFCSHGAGTTVKWYEADARMHIKFNSEKTDEEAKAEYGKTRMDSAAFDDELKAIFERTYGKIERRMFDKPSVLESKPRMETTQIIEIPKRPEYLIVDGYNIIFAWDDLKEAAKSDLETARRLLGDILDNYAAQSDEHVILVFDAYKVKRNPGSHEKYGNIEIVYTKEAQTADSYIEKLAYGLSKLNRVRVATSDGTEQLVILGSGALRVSASELKDIISKSNEETRKAIEKLTLVQAGANMGEALSAAKKRKETQ